MEYDDDLCTPEVKNITMFISRLSFQCFRLIFVVYKFFIMQMVHFISCTLFTNRISLLFTIFYVKYLLVFTECDFKYIQEPKQNTHILTYSEEKSSFCTACVRLILLVYKIIIILSTMFNVKNLLVFTECDFKYILDLKHYTNILTHSGEKPPSYTACLRLILLVCKIRIKLFIIFNMENLSVFTECDLKYIQEPKHYTNILTHSGEKPSSCTICFRLIVIFYKIIIMQLEHFTSNMSPTNRISLLFDIFSVKNLLVSTECDFKYTHEPNLHSHILNHSEEKPFSCTVCDYDPSNQIIYILTHTGEISTYTKKYNFENATIISILIKLIYNG